MRQDAMVLLEWLREILTWHDGEMIHAVEASPTRVRVHLYTASYRYTLAGATPTLEAGVGVRPSYLGCVAQTRMPRPGEDWTRGNDLPDGPLTRETFDAILRAIVGYELLPIAERKEPTKAEAAR